MNAVMNALGIVCLFLLLVLLLVLIGVLYLLCCDVLDIDPAHPIRSWRNRP